MADAPWLDDDEMDAWLALVGVLLRLGPALDSQAQRDAGMTHFDYQVLAMLSEAPERTLAMSELAHRVNASLSRLSHVVKKLELRGWIVRRPSPTSRRVTECTLTPSGYDVLVDAAPGHVRAVRQLVFDGLTPEQVRQLTAIASTMRSNLDESDLGTLDG
ncbi:DNA-binding MarR family transcriptional regulator [Nocardioides zeae]|uniref:DNA-binding MarR family transcriptional regulator n=1 Tax=Nocardioides zeae TaxID=1457234 RepID=A0ACC6ICQ1_9ACTN|nr:MarR family transcriptional regulator [Nocardioides zeae]MDR6175504.1 DNA-binding MarR family transcriptional regulator [Nocardioides zeae]MDR6208435.1 DNA-binding MarR family transcriptional regulator [Nocardioides zeae]